jgi:hypothetical protein
MLKCERCPATCRSLDKTPPPLRVWEPPPSAPIKPVTNGLAGSQVCTKPQNVIVRVRDLTFARSPGVIRGRVTKMRASRAALRIEGVNSSRADPQPRSELALIAFAEHDRRPIASDLGDLAAAPLQLESELRHIAARKAASLYRAPAAATRC